MIFFQNIEQNFFLIVTLQFKVNCAWSLVKNSYRMVLPMQIYL